MPPRKKKFDKDDPEFQQFLEKQKITFEGPVAPRNWPYQHLFRWNGPYKHRFSPIREIWGNRYDEAEKYQRKQARILKERAYSRRGDIKLNEITWRNTVENLVFERFSNDVLCKCCGDEKIRVNYVADPLLENEKKKVDEKRILRKRCACLEKNPKPMSTRDDEWQLIFTFACSGEVLHEPQERHLRKSGIPMEPDRVVGLSCTPRMREEVSSFTPGFDHYPIRGIQILYPFLVVEAKKARDAPGFRSIERQTAYVIRRFLRLQEHIQNGCEDECEPPLVWFVAYQGEVWRVYAGTLNNSAVKVYELWQGTIESEDGALQLVQIMDYIWSWARDIYRPQIRNCLRRSLNRGISPASTICYRQSPPVCSERRISTVGERLASPENSYPPAGSASNQPIVIPDDPMETDPNPSADPAVQISLLQGLRSHPFLKWSEGSKVIIRHSDIVTFCFNIIEVTDIEEFLAPTSTSHSRNDRETLIELYRSSIPIRKDLLRKLKEIWTRGFWTISKQEECESIIQVSFIYQTYCRPSDWQIVREMNCIIWPPFEADLERLLNRNIVPMNASRLDIDLYKLSRVLRSLRGLHGHRSVSSALENQFLILISIQFERETGGQDHNIQLVPPDFGGISERTIRLWLDLFIDGSSVQGLQELFPEQEDPPPQMLGAIDRQAGVSGFIPGPQEVALYNDGVMALKSNSWPSDTPEYCLFVMLKENFDDVAVLKSLLRDFGHDDGRKLYAQRDITADDRATIRRHAERIIELRGSDGG